MTDTRETFRKNFDRLYTEKRCTQEDMAKTLGVSRATVSTWLRGTGFPRADVLDAMAAYFGVSIAELLSSGSSDDEAELIELYRKMSDAGKALMIERAHELVILYGGEQNNSTKSSKEVI